MTYSFLAYIDESGDDGIKRFRQVARGGSSHWLTIAALIVSRANDTQLPRWRDEIARINPGYKRRDLHFVDMKENHRLAACQELARKPVRFVVIMSNKTTIPTHPRKDLFRRKNTLYQYMCRYLLERVTSFARRKFENGASEGNGKIRIIFSRRGGMSYEDFRLYMHRLSFQQQMTGNGPELYWPAIDIDDIDALDHKNRAGLQLADLVASAFSAAVEPNSNGGFNPSYAKALAPRVLMSLTGSRIGCGLKPVPKLSEMALHPEQAAFFEWYQNQVGRPLAPVPSPCSTTDTRR